MFQQAHAHLQAKHTMLVQIVGKQYLFKMSIFISIASYRDPELENTIRSAIDNADNPSQLYFGVVAQHSKKELPDLSWVPLLKLIVMHPKQAMGAGYARSEAMKLYNGEDYYLQIDSHTRFAKGWDTICVSEIDKAEKIANNNKIILSYFPAPFIVERNGKIAFVKEHKKIKDYPTTQYPGLNKQGKWTAIREDFIDKQRKNPELSKTVLGGFIFCSGNIVKEVPYDPEISFFGEEICFAMRAWTRGWDIYSPSKDIVYHFYHRGDYPKIWKDVNVRKISWKEIESNSFEKQKNVLCGIEKGIFGAGKERSLKKYQDFVNINFKNHYGLTKQTNKSTIDLLGE